MSNFPGRIFVFVSIEIYADESGTHDETGKQRGAEVAVINGLAGWKTSWATFARKWRQCLKRNRVDCFHASDLANSTRYPNRPSVYKSWRQDRKDKFAEALAKMAARSAICPVGGNVPTEWIHDENAAKGETGEYPYRRCFDWFFRSVTEELGRMLPNYQGNITFFFDRNQNPKWEEALRESHRAFAKTDRRFAVDPVTGDKRVIVPLQAADLIAYETRKVAVAAWREARRLGRREPVPQPVPKLLQILNSKMPNSQPGLTWEKAL